MPNPFLYIYIQYIISKHILLILHTNNSIKHQSSVYTQLNDQTVLIQCRLGHQSFVYTQLNIKVIFQSIQFSLSTEFKCQTVLFDPLIGPHQVLPLRARVDLGAIAMKGYSAFSKAQALSEPHHQIV